MTARQVPVIVGASEIANKDDERIVHPGDLLEAVARQALDDSGSDLTALLGAIYSCPLSIFSDLSGSELVGERLGAPPGRRVVDPGYSGTGPLAMLDDACRRVADGEIDAALVVGGVADASVRRARARGVEPPAPPGMTLSLGTGGGAPELPAELAAARAASAEARAGVGSPSEFFALAESRMAQLDGHSPGDRRAYLGELLSRFSEVASTRGDLAWFPETRKPDDIAGVSGDNRLIAEPYTKLMCSFPTVDLAAAVLVTSVAVADRLGIAQARRVYPWAIGSARDPRSLAERPEIRRAPALNAAVETVLETLSLTAADIKAFDFYSCFPAASQLAAHAFGLDPLDPRGLTVTGGMPYFGGPGASYGLHGLAAMVDRCRDEAGELGAVVGLGGMMEKFAVGVLSTRPPEADYGSLRIGDIPQGAERVPLRSTGSGPAHIFAGTVVHSRSDGPVAAPVIAELPDGSRVGARAAGSEVVHHVAGTALVGRPVTLRSEGDETVYEPS